MPRPRNADFFASLRGQAQRALATISAEIDRRQRELKHLMEQAQGWRSALGMGGGTSARRARAVRRRGRGRPVGGRSGRRVNWDEVLSSVPKRFSIGDIMKHPGARAKGRAQVYPALTRWEAAKKIRRIAQGQYERVSGGDSSARPAAKARRGQRRKLQRRRMKRSGRKAAVKRATAKASANGRVDWDAVLKGLPPKFGAADVLKNPAAAAKGAAQVYPAIGRWVATKKAKKIGTGQYAKI